MQVPNSSHDPAISTERISKGAEKLLSANLLTDIATNHYQKCQIQVNFQNNGTKIFDDRLERRNDKGNETWVSHEVFYGVNS